MSENTRFRHACLTFVFEHIHILLFVLVYGSIDPYIVRVLVFENFRCSRCVPTFVFRITNFPKAIGHPSSETCIFVVVFDVCVLE